MKKLGAQVVVAFLGIALGDNMAVATNRMTKDPQTTKPFPADSSSAVPQDGLGSSAPQDPQEVFLGPLPTDAEGQAGGGGAPSEASPRMPHRADDEKRIHEEIVKWDHKIADLKGELRSNSAPPTLRKTVQLLEHMHSEASKDLNELRRVQDPKVWRDVKARVDARFHKMTKEWERVLPKEKTT